MASWSSYIPLMEAAFEKKNTLKEATHTHTQAHNKQDANLMTTRGNKSNTVAETQRPV